jgi:hypothetical protein
MSTKGRRTAEAFGQAGQSFSSLKITLYNAELEQLKAYTWANATVVGYRQTGDSSTNSSDQDLVLQSTSLTVTPYGSEWRAGRRLVAATCEASARNRIRYSATYRMM